MAKPWPLSSALAAELVPAAEAARSVTAWTDLARRAIEPNAFYAPGTALAALAHLPEGRGARVCLAWRGEGETRRLVGMLPLARARGRYLNPLPMRRAAACYGTVSTPLLDPDRPDETLAAMLRTLDGAGVRAVLLPYLVEDGPVASALATAASAGIPVERLGAHQRASLDARQPSGGYVKATFEPRRRKEVERKRRRFAEAGTVSFAVATGEQDVMAALEVFLDLEAGGWKGRAHTALKLAPGGAPFIRDAARAGAREGTFRIATLALDGRVVAAGLVAVAGRRAFYMKTAYDEEMARFSPGLLLTLDLTANLLDDPSIDDADSIAVADHPMIDRAWLARLPMMSCLVGTRPGRTLSFAGALAVERWRETAVARLKARLAAFKASRAPSANDADRKAGPTDAS